LVMVGCVGWAGLEQAPLPAITWVSKPVTSKRRRRFGCAARHCSDSPPPRPQPVWALGGCRRGLGLLPRLRR
jgi:hypothetical protein